MANNATNALEEKILTGILDSTNAFTVSANTLKLRLYSTIPSANDIETGTEGTLITSAGGYLDKALTTTEMEVDTTSNVTKLRNKIEISFGAATADYSAQVKAVGIIGNVNGAGVVPLFVGGLTTVRTGSSGDSFKFAINALSVDLS